MATFTEGSDSGSGAPGKDISSCSHEDRYILTSQLLCLLHDLRWKWSLVTKEYFMNVMKTLVCFFEDKEHHEFKFLFDKNEEHCALNHLSTCAM